MLQPLYGGVDKPPFSPFVKDEYELMIADISEERILLTKIHPITNLLNLMRILFLQSLKTVLISDAKT